MLFTLIIPIEVIYAKESLDSTSAGFGLLLASWGAGIVAREHASMLVVARRSPASLILALHRSDRPRLSAAWRSRRRLLSPACCAVLGGTGNGVQWVVGDDGAAGGDAD